jgi:precorrin-6A/cobalt-precorrin-6A reductase
MVSSGATASANTEPAPCQNGSPEHNATTRWPRCTKSFGIEAANGVSHSKVGLPCDATSARCRRPPAINSARASNVRAAADRPSSPSSPIPTMDSQGAGMSSLAVMTFSPERRLRVLILGGTADANRLVAAVANDPRIDAVLSYAGRTENPTPPPISWRVGGFGGIDGLVRLSAAPKASRASSTPPIRSRRRSAAHAMAACAVAAVPLLALERPPWQCMQGDRWIEVDDLKPRRPTLSVQRRAGCFSASAGSILNCFAAHPQHAYLVRLVDPPRAPLPLRDAEVIVARGPFDSRRRSRHA